MRTTDYDVSDNGEDINNGNNNDYSRSVKCFVPIENSIPKEGSTLYNLLYRDDLPKRGTIFGPPGMEKGSLFSGWRCGKGIPLSVCRYWKRIIWYMKGQSCDSVIKRVKKLLIYVYKWGK